MGKPKSAPKSGKTGAAKPTEKTPEELEQERLESEVDKAVAGPAVATPEAKPLEDSAVQEDKKGVQTIKPTGKFEVVGNLIFNREGVHVGTEVDSNTAARKADRFNSQTQRGR